jgi:metallo-beta-lactamase family protein
MKITFYGAAQEVTGSMHLIEVNGHRILLDCGMFQGHRAEAYERNLHFPFDPSVIDTLVLSHAHIDHSGNIPNLVKQGFKGNIWCTAATRNLCTYMLLDSGHIQESDIEYVNKKRKRTGEPPVEPLYTQADARTSLAHFIGVGLHRPVTIAEGVTLTFYNAGHILGSAFSALDIEDRETGKRQRLVFSGDVGRPEAPILCSPEAPGDADILIVESTYGNRVHGDYGDARRKLRSIIQTAASRRGKVIIPAFAVGRTQEIVFALNELESEGDIPAMPVFVDSPLAINATEVFRLHPEDWDEQVREFLTEGNNRRPFDFSRLEYVREARRSKQLNHVNGPLIIISASGMAETGRILHHLANNIENPDNVILFVGFQAENTLGRRILDGVSPVRIFGDEYKVRAQVASIEGYSAHADRCEIESWVATFDRARLQHTFVVHGEPESAAAMADLLAHDGYQNVTAPTRGQSFEL